MVNNTTSANHTTSGGRLVDYQENPLTRETHAIYERHKTMKLRNFDPNNSLPDIMPTYLGLIFSLHCHKYGKPKISEDFPPVWQDPTDEEIQLLLAELKCPLTSSCKLCKENWAETEFD